MNKNLESKQVTDVLMLSHFHRDYPFNLSSSWLKASHAGDSEFENPLMLQNSVNTSDEEIRIQEYQRYYPQIDEKQFLTAMGQQATEYWIWKHAQAKYIGCTSYRRYLLIEGSRWEARDTARIVQPPTPEMMDFLSSDKQKETAMEVLETHDVITNLPMHSVVSVERQYTASEPRDYWDLFMEGIIELFPEYRKHMYWFKQRELHINFEAPYIMSNALFKRCIGEYFTLMEYLWQRIDNTFPTHEFLVQHRKPVGWWMPQGLPWRYPGFLNERFVPFFIFANQLKPYYVPLVILNVFG